MNELGGGVAFAYAKTPAILVFTRLTIWVAWCMFSKKTTDKKLVPILAGGMTERSYGKVSTEQSPERSRREWRGKPYGYEVISSHCTIDIFGLIKSSSSCIPTILSTFPFAPPGIFSDGYFAMYAAAAMSSYAEYIRTEEE